MHMYVSMQVRSHAPRKHREERPVLTPPKVAGVGMAPVLDTGLAAAAAVFAGNVAGKQCWQHAQWAKRSNGESCRQGPSLLVLAGTCKVQHIKDASSCVRCLQSTISPHAKHRHVKTELGVLICKVVCCNR